MQGPHEEGHTHEQDGVLSRFLHAVKDLSPTEAQERVRAALENHPDPDLRGESISWLSIQNYRKGETSPTAATLRKMRAYLEPERPENASASWDEGYRAAIREMEMVLGEMMGKSTSRARSALDAARNAARAASTDSIPEHEGGAGQ